MWDAVRRTERTLRELFNFMLMEERGGVSNISRLQCDHAR